MARGPDRDRRAELSRRDGGSVRAVSAAGLLSPGARSGHGARRIDPDHGPGSRRGGRLRRRPGPGRLPGAAGRAARRPADQRAGQRTAVHPDRHRGIERGRRAATVPRPAVQYLGHVRRDGHAEAVPTARARSQSRHRGPRRVEQGRHRRRGPAVRLGRGRLAAPRPERLGRPGDGGGEADGRRGRLGAGPGRARRRQAVRRRGDRGWAARWPRSIPPCTTRSPPPAAPEATSPR